MNLGQDSLENLENSLELENIVFVLLHKMCEWHLLSRLKPRFNAITVREEKRPDKSLCFLKPNLICFESFKLFTKYLYLIFL